LSFRAKLIKSVGIELTEADHWQNPVPPSSSNKCLRCGLGRHCTL